MDREGTSNLFAATDTGAISEEVEEVVSKAGYEPHGYFIEGLASFLLRSNGQAPEELSFDSEAGMFSVIGSKDVLEPLKQQLSELFANPSELKKTIDRDALDECRRRVQQEVLRRRGRKNDRRLGKTAIQQLVDSLATGVPACLVEVRRPGRTLNKRRRHPRLLRSPRHQQRAHRNDHQLHLQKPLLGRWVQTLPVPSFAMSPIGTSLFGRTRLY